MQSFPCSEHCRWNSPHLQVDTRISQNLNCLHLGHPTLAENSLFDFVPKKGVRITRERVIQLQETTQATLVLVTEQLNKPSLQRVRVMLQDKLHMPYMNQTEVRNMLSVISRLLHHSALLVALYFTFFVGAFSCVHFMKPGKQFQILIF